jgi:phosphopantothenoylcysteine synthetase/decarboxylase
MNKKILVTAGNTRVPIDKVRGIDNIFKGRTGCAIAEYFADAGSEVTLLTSNPDVAVPRAGLKILKFTTFAALRDAMESLITTNPFDVIIHSAAVSDYSVAGTYFQDGDAVMIKGHKFIELVDLDHTGKIGSDHKELWMKLVPTIKIVDQIREPWGFKGKLVKFKLQVGMNDKELLEIAKRSMHHSKADFIVANTLEGLTNKAFIISAKSDLAVEVSRVELPAVLYEELMHTVKPRKEVTS